MKKILIAEDEKGIINFLEQGLTEEGFEIETATNGVIALEKYHSFKPDLILLDWMMPFLSGLEVCKTIRTTDKTTPILFLTAKDTVLETVEGLQAGANDYIKKPFSFEELLARINIHFRTSVAEELHIENIKIIPSKYEVYVADELVSLTQREYELLLYLVKNKGKVTTRNEIIENVWNVHFEYDTGVIDVFINAIRKKLNLTKDNETIKTIRGVGYLVQ